uniref:ARAD1A18238p n=1 Tax=Blastobotrys adeninivorans TaxID=409370 RepID=A0A060SZ76_BLAAD
MDIINNKMDTLSTSPSKQFGGTSPLEGLNSYLDSKAPLDNSKHNMTASEMADYIVGNPDLYFQLKRDLESRGFDFLEENTVSKEDLTTCVQMLRTGIANIPFDPKYLESFQSDVEGLIADISHIVEIPVYRSPVTEAQKRLSACANHAIKRRLPSDVKTSALVKKTNYLNEIWVALSKELIPEHVIPWTERTTRRPSYWNK